MFYIGQKVVAIRSCQHQGYHGYFKKDEIFTVINTVIDPFGRLGLCFLELSLPPIFIGFEAQYFRPAVERKTDISIFKKMLLPENANA